MAEPSFDNLRRCGFAIAYRMLGSVADAEDVVQEAMLRFHRAGTAGKQIESPRAYLSTVVSRLALDQLRSTRRRRETYVGEWLPEPLLSDLENDPARRLETAESLSLAFLVVLESLSPEQRAAFLLHDVFDEPYGRIAQIIDTSEDNARQLASRARRHVRERRPRYESSSEQAQQLAARFFAAAEDGDLEGLEALLAADVVLQADSGGNAPAIKRSVHGRAKVARSVIAGLGRGRRLSGFSWRPEMVNGQPGAAFVAGDGRLAGVMILAIAERQIQTISAIVNPDKLRHLGPVADLNALLREPRSRAPLQ